jgi:hypothetical protein
MPLSTFGKVLGLDGMVNICELLMKRRKLQTAKVDDWKYKIIIICTF